MNSLPQALSEADESILSRAFDRLEHPSFAVRLTNVVGTPIEMALKLLPTCWYKRMHRHAEACIGKALDLAISNVSHTQQAPSNDRRYKLLGMTSGALAGLLGGPAMLLELPVTTTLMLSAIADIARKEGEDLAAVETRLACLEVFALGGRSDEDDAADTGYYGLRLALEAPIANASKFLAHSSLAARGQPPVMVNLINTVAKRFGVVLSEKAAAEIIPIVGAVGGALINRLFMEHFQDMARSHFSLRRLERKYGIAMIQEAYARIKQERTSHPLQAAYRQLSVIGAAAA